MRIDYIKIVYVVAIIVLTLAMVGMWTNTEVTNYHYNGYYKVDIGEAINLKISHDEVEIFSIPGDDSEVYVYYDFKSRTQYDDVGCIGDEVDTTSAALMVVVTIMASTTIACLTYLLAKEPD